MASIDEKPEILSPSLSSPPANPLLSGNVEWLLALDKEVRAEHDGMPPVGRYETFIDKRILTEDEMKKIFNIVKDEDNYIFTPDNVGFGFRVGFRVFFAHQVAPGVPPEISHLFTISEKQLPDGWGWNEMKPHFTSNKKRNYYGMESVQQKGHYEY